MKFNNFLTEHSLTISSVGDEFVLTNIEEDEISPRFGTSDAVKMWAIKNTSEIFYKLYTEGN